MRKLLILFILLSFNIAYAACGCASVNLVDQEYEEGQGYEDGLDESQQKVEVVQVSDKEKVTDNIASPITGAAVTEIYEGKDEIIYFVPIILFFIILNIIIYLKRKKN